MKRAYVDANVILRYLTRDPPEMAEAALRTFTTAQRGKVRLLLTPITVAEVVWVLESFYGHPRAQVAQTLTEFLHADGLEVESLDLLIEAPELVIHVVHVIGQGPEFVPVRHLDALRKISHRDPPELAVHQQDRPHQR